MQIKSIVIVLKSLNRYICLLLFACSDIVVQIVDARNPLLFLCKDLETYVKEVSKSKVNVILINKSDFLTHNQRYLLWIYANCILLFFLPSVLWRCWLVDREGIWPVKKWAVGYWRGYLSGARCRLVYGPADSTATTWKLSLASVKSRLVLPFWYRLTQVVLDKGPLNGCVCILFFLCQCVYVGYYYKISWHNFIEFLILTWLINNWKLTLVKLIANFCLKQVCQ